MNTESQSPALKSLPLAGKTIIVTRALSQARGLANGLEALGATVIEFPTIEVKLLKASISFYVDSFDWIVFTSANGVRGLRNAMEDYAQSFCLINPRICAVGPATKRTLEGEGVEVDLVPETYSVEGVYDALKTEIGDLGGQRFLLPQGNIARNMLSEALLADGVEVTPVEVYETTMPKIDSTLLGELLAVSPDMITFTSGSTARNFVKMQAHHTLADVDYASIGPFTTEVAESCGLTIAVEPEQHDIPGLINAITTFYTD